MKLLKQRARSRLSDISHGNYKQKMKAKKQANKQIHGLLFLFENGDFFLRFGLLSTRIR